MDPTTPQQPSQPPAPPPNQPPVSWTPQSPPPPGAFNFSDFVNFRYLITPGFITVIYVVGAIFITIAALSAAGTAGAGGVLVGLLWFVFGNLWWRVVLEFVMVLFRINDHLASIDRRGQGI
jgi:Domain of unknown function (DUF4282)